MSTGTVVVDTPGPPRVIIQIMSKTFEAQSVPTSPRTVSVGNRLGNVIDLNCSHIPAPSTLAASYSSSGTLARDARKIMVKKGTYLQELTNVRLIPAISGLARKSRGFSNIPIPIMDVFMIPEVASNIQRQRIAVTAAGTAQGSKIQVRTKFCPLKG